MFQIPKAIQDIAKLAQGVNRAEVALEALKESELTPKQVQKLEALLKKVSAPSATTSPAFGEIKTIDNHQAVVGQITVNGQQLDTLLSEGSSNKSRSDQEKYAAELDCRMATRAENRKYVDSLLAKEEDDLINAAEANALKTYRDWWVRDDQGALGVDGRRVRDRASSGLDDGFPYRGALFVRASAESIKAEGHALLGRVEDKALSDEEFNRLENAPETQRIMGELEWLKTVTPTDFCEEMERREQLPRELLGKNFLGAEAWRKQGIDAGVEPALPASITEELLNSECPLHPGEKIKDTHLLVLVPKTVNGEPYTALKLDELCATRKGSGDKLIYDGADWATAWKEKDWASTAQVQSEWVLIPKSDPDPKKVPADKHFRSKNIAAQQKVHDEHYPEYREVKTLELMTAVLLYDLANKERLAPDYLRCEEPNASGGRVCVGRFIAYGLEVSVGRDDNGGGRVGRALARKL